MVTACRIGDTNANDDHSEERRVGQRDPETMKVICRVKRYFIDARFERVGGQKRCLGSAVGICRDSSNQSAFGTLHEMELDGDAVRRHAS